MLKKITEKNSYILIFSIVMAVVIGAVLAYASVSLKPFQDENKLREKKKNILSAIGYEVDMQQATEAFKSYIKESLVLDAKGNPCKEVDVFSINIALEFKKESRDRKLPVYRAEKNRENYFIFPLYGSGLWGPIWGYVALNSNYQLTGVVFDHASETPGLGAEITQDFFKDRFKGKHIFDSSNEYKPIEIIKGDATSSYSKVDGISGATITSRGVGEMLLEGLAFYLPYLKRIKK